MNAKKVFSVILVLAIIALALSACAPSPEAQGTTSAAGEYTPPATTLDYEDDNVPFTWPSALMWIALISALSLGAWSFRGKFIKAYDEIKTPNKGTLFLAAFFMLLFLVSTSIKVVPVTFVGVVRQVVPSTNYYVVGPGTHIVPPVVSKLHLYTTRVRQMKIFNIQADSASPGRPAVYPDIVVWFRLPIATGSSELNFTQISVDTDGLRLLDFRYGPSYEESFLKEKIIAAVKEISGSHGYDYFGNDRVNAQVAISAAVTAKLEGLVKVQDVTISDFSYNPDFEAKLQDLAKKQIELEQATRDVTIAEQRKLEAEKMAQKRQVEGQGERDYQIEVAKGQAEALRLVAEQLKSNPALIPYEWIKKWAGEVPYLWQGGDASGGSSFLFQLPSSNSTTP